MLKTLPRTPKEQGDGGREKVDVQHLIVLGRLVLLKELLLEGGG